jgi:Flp pilus assembly protein TadD
LYFSPFLGPTSLAAAEAHLRRVLESDPTNPDARSLLTSLYANTGRPASPP